MNSDTPARCIPPGDLARNRNAFRYCLTQVANVGLVLDIRYGTGKWAAEVHRRYPEAMVIGYEMDPETASSIAEGVDLERLALRVACFEPAEWKERVVEGSRRVDLLCADFNNLTVKSRKPLDEALAVVEPCYVAFTDVAVAKLHINYVAYGLKTWDLHDYWKAFRIPGYELVTFSCQHRMASTALYVNEKTLR